MAYSYKRHTNTARIQALSDLLKTVKDIKEPSWAEKEAIKMENNMKVAAHNAEIAAKKRDEADWKQIQKMDKLTAGQLEKSSFVDLSKDPLVMGKQGVFETKQARRRNKKRKAESGNWWAAKNYRRLRQKDFTPIATQLATDTLQLETQVYAALQLQSTNVGGRTLQSTEKAKEAVVKFYGHYFNNNYQQEWMNYGSASQRTEYGMNLASVEAMMIELGLEIPKHSISDTFRNVKTVGKWDRPKVYEPNKY
tara:strand:+ start:6077 stop:6829 length:753 start_codon:yes stop_codon:yes gene_type:complete